MSVSKTRPGRGGPHSPASTAGVRRCTRQRGRGRSPLRGNPTPLAALHLAGRSAPPPKGGYESPPPKAGARIPRSRDVRTLPSRAGWCAGGPAGRGQGVPSRLEDPRCTTPERLPPLPASHRLLPATASDRRPPLPTSDRLLPATASRRRPPLPTSARRPPATTSARRPPLPASHRRSRSRPPAPHHAPHPHTAPHPHAPHPAPPSHPAAGGDGPCPRPGYCPRPGSYGSPWSAAWA